MKEGPPFGPSAVASTPAWLAELPVDDPEAAMEDGADVVTPPPASQDGAADAAIAAELEQRQDFAALVEHLLACVERAGDARARTALLARLAHLFETRFADPQRAFVTLSSALDEAPTEAVLADLDRLASGLGQRADLLDQAEQAAGNAPEGDRRAALLWTTVARWARALGQVERAAAAAERAHAIDPDFLPALSEWEEALRAMERWGDLARVLASRAERQPGMALSLHLELAALWEERIGDHERAIRACRQALGCEPEDPTALARLRRLAKQQGQTALYAEALERSLPIATSAIERSDLLAKLAAAWEALDRREQAGQALEQLIDAEPGHEFAHAELARLNREGQNWQSLAAVLGRHAETASDPTRQQALLFEAAEIAHARLQRRSDAIALFERVLSLAPGHVASLRALVDLRRRGEQWQSLGDLLIRLAENTPDREEKKAALLEAAEIREKRLGDRSGGAQLYSWVNELDPDDTAAVERLFDGAAQEGDQARVLALGDWLLARTQVAAGQASICERMVPAALALGERDRALALCERAGALGADGTELCAAWVDLAVERQQWPRAAGLYRTLIGREAIDVGRRVGFAIGLGHASLAMNLADDAVRAFLHAIDLDAASAGALAGLARAHATRGDHAAAIEARARLFRLVDDENQRIDLTRETVRVYRDVLGRPEKAVEALTNALSVLSDSHQLSHDLLDLHTATKNWPAALAVLERLAGRAKGALRAKYLIAAGNILCYETRQIGAAVERFNEALDADPRDLKVFEKIDRLLTREQDWKEQERSYRRMLKRIEQQGAGPASHAAEVALWQGLGEIYRSRLQDLDSAVVAFEVVKKLKNADKESSQILAEIYEHTGPQNYPQAIEENRELLARATSVQEMAQHLRALQRLYSRLRDFERAYSATAALVVLREATVNDRQYYRQYTSHAYHPPQARLTEEFWRQVLYHRDVDVRLSAIFASVGRHVALAHAKTAKEWRVNLRAAHSNPNVAAFEQHGARFVEHIGGLLGVAPPPVTARPDLAAEMDLVPVGGGDKVETALVLGAPMLAPRSDKDFAFAIGRALARARPEHLVLWPNIVPSLTELRAALFAVVRLAGAAEVPADMMTLSDGHLRLFQERIPPRDLEGLAALGRSLAPADLDLPRWIRGVIFTINRAALLACNDLETAARLVQSESVSTVTVGRFEQIQDLVWWSVSEEFASFRRQFTAPPARSGG